jgi:hypothetical protein
MFKIKLRKELYILLDQLRNQNLVLGGCTFYLKISFNITLLKIQLYLVLSGLGLGMQMPHYAPYGYDTGGFGIPQWYL